MVHRGLHARRAAARCARRSACRSPGPANTAFDGLYLVPTLDEVIDLARHSVSCDGRQVGVYPETKHPTYFDSIGLSLEEPLVAALQANGVDRADAPVIVQSFEVANLRELDGMTEVDSRSSSAPRAGRTTSSPPATRAPTPTS